MDGVIIHMPALAALALGGGLGGVARFWVAAAVARRLGERFPWGTLVVNVSGAALIGILAALLLSPGGFSVEQPTIWAGLVIGLLGSYTTVSSFSLQTLALLRNGAPGYALANVLLSLVFCLAAAAGGWLVAGHLLAAAGAT